MHALVPLLGYIDDVTVKVKALGPRTEISYSLEFQTVRPVQP